jgi:hypothetical protein
LRFCKESCVRVKMLAGAIATAVLFPGLTAANPPAPAEAPPQPDEVARGSDPPGQSSASSSISGTIFVDFSDVDPARNGSKTDASGTSLDVTRFYLSFDHAFNDVWSANLTTDANYASATGESEFFVKKAYVQGAFSRMATLRVGAAGTPWIPFVEDWYGYRFVEKLLVDRLKLASSADWGLHLAGDDGVFDYQVSAVTGAGYRNPTRPDHVDIAARFGVQPVKGLVFAIGGYEGELGAGTSTAPAVHTAHRYDAMAAWNRDGLRLGGEWFKAGNWKNVTTPTADSASGWSLWGSYDFARASIFARYDRAEPSKQLDPSLRDTYWHTGVAFPVSKGVRIALAFKDERVRNATGTDVHSREIGGWGEIKW